VLVGDLLKTTRASQIFSVFGQPDVRVKKQEDGTCVVQLRGVDVYNPLTGEVHSTRGEDVAAWFLDTDYDGKTFHICQAFFPSDANAWEKLQRALKAEIDAEAFERMRGTVSFPFQPGQHRRIAVKVIDFRGNEVVRMMPLENISYKQRRARTMYQSFKISNFRCFRETTLNSPERVNLIAGMNNVGKTALLEALFLHSGAYNPELTLRLNAFRGIQQVELEFGRWVKTPWDSLFSQFDTSKIVELVGENEKTGLRILRLRVIRQPEELAKIGQSIQHSSDKSESTHSFTSETAQVLELECTEGKQPRKYYMILDRKGVRIEPIPPPPPFPAVFLVARGRVSLAEDAESFGKLEILGQQDVLLKALQVIEARLRRLAVVVVGGVPMIHGDIGLGRLVPLPVMGEGMTRLANLVLAIGNAPNGVVLVDEIENGLHHSILSKVWRAIGEVARQFNTQVFATTHSLECIIAAHRAFSESGCYDFRLHRLERVNETIRAVTYDQETLEAAIETGLEVR
jgi:hypothetical protein